VEMTDKMEIEVEDNVKEEVEYFEIVI